MSITRRNFMKAAVVSALSLPFFGCSGSAVPALSKTLTAQESRSGLSYWLYTPQDTSVEKPLILYLHGGSGKGSDLNAIVSVDGLPRFLQQGALMPDAYVVIPQLPASCKGWSERSGQIFQLLDEFRHQFPISHISMTGHSMGGTGTWDIALERPDFFAAVAPLSGSIQATEQTLTALKDLPVWAIVGSDDTIVPPDNTIQFLQELKKVNSSAKLTVLDGAGHFDVPQAYLDSSLGLLSWLIASKP